MFRPGGVLLEVIGNLDLQPYGYGVVEDDLVHYGSVVVRLIRFSLSCTALSPDASVPNGAFCGIGVWIPCVVCLPLYAGIGQTLQKQDI